MKSKKLFSALALAVTAMVSGSVFAVSVENNIALGKSTSASSTYDTRFHSSNVTDGDIFDASTTTNATFWIAKDNSIADAWVQVDLGETFQISSVNLFDTHNRTYKDRGTDAFTLSVSTDGNTFSNIAAGAFTDVQWKTQSAFAFDSLSAEGRYVRFTANSAFGGKGSAGLAEIQVYGSVVEVPEPESYAMLLAGLGLMGTIARRRSKSKAS